MSDSFSSGGTAPGPACVLASAVCSADERRPSSSRRLAAACTPNPRWLQGVRRQHLRGCRRRQACVQLRVPESSAAGPRLFHTHTRAATTRPPAHPAPTCPLSSASLCWYTARLDCAQAAAGFTCCSISCTLSIDWRMALICGKGCRQRRFIEQMIVMFSSTNKEIRRNTHTPA